MCSHISQIFVTDVAVVDIVDIVAVVVVVAAVVVAVVAVAAVVVVAVVVAAGHVIVVIRDESQRCRKLMKQNSTETEQIKETQMTK